MSTFEYHCQESIRLFGKPYEDVHRWLDEFAGGKEYGYRHRKLRHHEEGIRQAVECFGNGAGEAARRHILTDLAEEGWTKNDRFPKDEADYMRMGLF